LMVCVAVLFSCCVHADEATEKRKAAIVRPCAEEARASPVRKECVAAAIAEEAFLGETHRRRGSYLITAMRHSAEQWKFMILGSNTHPSAAGSDWMVFVDRRTGKVELIEGR
jgi:hypothetical protein